MLDKEKYLVPAEPYENSTLLSEWKWLTGEDMRVIALTKTGDCLLQNKDNNLLFLDTGFAHITFISDDWHDFPDRNLSIETLEQILQNEVVDHLEECGVILKEGEVYSFKTLPVLGGEYDEKNMFPMNVVEHFKSTGKAQFKIKDLPVEPDVEEETETEEQ